MYYGYGPDTPGWDRDREGRLYYKLDSLRTDYPYPRIHPRITRDEHGIVLRAIGPTWLTDAQREELLEKANALYQEVMVEGIW